MQKTTLAKEGEIKRNWVIVDLNGKVLGRAATQIAIILRGKNKVIYTPHADTGDFVVAINAQGIRLTGKKNSDKIYYSHSGFRGGLKEVTAEKLLLKDPTELVRKAVHGMLPKNRLSKHLIRKLKIYPTAEHPHEAQQAKAITL
ncbi:MAG: 50S ribosomal protein L13 [Deltaproteobacteria bacterium]|nr:50S ribosomal protein L13 [Deltaproteobacteria bacterium]